ncbi:polyneuridine-aldehyde esterase-like [Syzygium oleosum]|uniref:polyneuridine-aldehyde esterase-like n=1 Tax=Syzygium oleosum TaxID=219896 RepID=UPI0024BB6B56|nr:polyneuridine-aldehyde esterase-like [Syzygium oleosum]
MASLREGDPHGAKLGQLECKSVHLQVPGVYSCRCFLAGSHAGHRTSAGNVLVELGIYSLKGQSLRLAPRSSSMEKKEVETYWRLRRSQVVHQYLLCQMYKGKGKAKGTLGLVELLTCGFRICLLLNPKTGQTDLLLSLLGGTSIKSKALDPIQTIRDFIRPLMELMPSLHWDEKVILVGHSYGGFCISLAMDSFPEKIEVAVYVAAYLNSHITTLLIIIGNKQVQTMYTVESHIQDLELAKFIRRPARMFMEELADKSLIAEERYGSVARVFVVCGDDKTMRVEFQRQIIDQNTPKAVKLIGDADHTAMLSKPHELCQCFEDIAKNYG